MIIILGFGAGLAAARAGVPLGMALLGFVGIVTAITVLNIAFRVRW